MRPHRFRFHRLCSSRQFLALSTAFLFAFAATAHGSDSGGTEASFPDSSAITVR